MTAQAPGPEDHKGDRQPRDTAFWAGSTQQGRIWMHVLKSLAAYFGVNEPVTLEKTLLDTGLQWSQAKTVWYNAGARSMLYTIMGLGRRMRNLVRRQPSR
jgi:hypothetical protein